MLIDHKSIAPGDYVTLRYNVSPREDDEGYYRHGTKASTHMLRPGMMLLVVAVKPYIPRVYVDVGDPGATMVLGLCPGQSDLTWYKLDDRAVNGEILKKDKLATCPALTLVLIATLKRETS